MIIENRSCNGDLGDLDTTLGTQHTLDVAVDGDWEKEKELSNSYRETKKKNNNSH